MRLSIFLTGVAMVASTTSLAGDLTQRFELTLNRVLQGGPPHYTTEFVVADAVPDHRRRFTEFSGDLSGRYIEALSVVTMQTSRTFPALHEVVREVLKHQKPDGHWGDPMTSDSITNRDMAMLWGNGRLLVGLTAYCRLSGDRDVLAAAGKLGDFLIAISPRLNTDKVQREFSDARIAVGYICWTQAIEGLVDLARITGDYRYVALAEQLAARTELYRSQHSHGFVTTLRGIVDLYQLTGKSEYLAQVEKAWDRIVQTGNVLPHGALPEAFKPSIDRDEGCSEADWLRLNLRLWSLTRNQRYIDMAELVLFNAFYFNQFGSGDFGHHHLTPSGIEPPSARAWWCCTLHGLRAFPDVFDAAFRSEGDTLIYDLPVDGMGEVAGLKVRAVSRLEQSGTVKFEVLAQSSPSRGFQVRCPGWAKQVPLLQGDTATAAGTPRAGDRLTARYQLLTRVTVDDQKRVALFRGPWLLAVDDEMSPRYFDEPSPSNRLDITEADIASHLSFAPLDDRDSGTLSVRAAHCQIRFLPGGYPMQPQTALLRPLCEMTASEDQTRWEFLFRL